MAFTTPSVVVTVGANQGAYALNVTPPAGFALTTFRVRPVGATVDEQLRLSDEFVVELRREGALVARIDGAIAIEGVTLPAAQPFTGSDALQITVQRQTAGIAFNLRVISIP